MGKYGQVLIRMKQILRVTRIFRLMRLVKLFQHYLVRACGPSLRYHCSTGKFHMG
jgi:hypothetical protein